MRKKNSIDLEFWDVNMEPRFSKPATISCQFLAWAVVGVAALQFGGFGVFSALGEVD